MDAESVASFLKAIQAAVSTTHQKDDDVALPIFDPDRNDCGAASWCDSIEKLAKDLNWSSLKTAAKAGKALKGSAVIWFESWEPVDGRSWEVFRTDITDSFPDKKNLSERLSKAVLFTSNSTESYGEYAREKLRLLRNTKISFTEAQLIELVCGSISDVDIKMASLNNGATTTSTLISLLSSYSKSRKRPLDINNTRDGGVGPSAVKQFKSNIKCFVCGKIGHQQTQCRFSNFPKTQQTSLVPKPSNSNDKICTYCKRIGHLESVCYHKQRAESSNRNASITLTTPPSKESNFLGKAN